MMKVSPVDGAPNAPPDPAICLGEGEAHLHVLRLDELSEVSESALLQRYGDLLTAQEHQRRNRFVPDHMRRTYLMTRALVRTTLSRYQDVDRRAWRFAANPHGRPFVSDPPVEDGLDFNLSTTDGLIVCLVARTPEVGVDVECTTRMAEIAGIAERFFSAREAAAVRALEGPAKRAGFFAYWTLKESYIKARGLGLSLPLDAFSFDLGPSAISIGFDDRIADRPQGWRFDRFALSERHVCAVALRFRSVDADAVSLRQFESIPAPA